MNYQKIYDQLIEKAKTQLLDHSYFELHHIVPQSLSGSNDKSNLIKLTARQHYLAHALLVKIFESTGDDRAYKKMLHAFNCMKWGRVDGERSFIFNSYLYGALKLKFSRCRSSLMKDINPMHDKIWIFNPNLKKSKIWNKRCEIPSGWFKGRILKFENLKKHNEKQIQKKLEKEQKIKLYREMFEEFKINDFEGVVKKFGYQYTRNNLLMYFKAYFDDYVPKICNRWKNQKSN